MTEHVERTRRSILSYFNARAEDYILVFTQNASAALKLVGESFPFAAGSRYLLTFDNHNSVNGIREFARAKGAAISYAPLVMPELRLDEAQLDTLLNEADPARANLFAFPAQSNFSGVKHPLELVAKARSKGWRVLLDAAAFVPTSRLDLTAVQPDFVTLSFYKMFGHPTGVGALLVRRSALADLKRPWFAGGTVNFASVQGQAHVLSPNEAAFEDGTLNYLSIPAVEIGLLHLQSIGIETIAERVRCLTGWLLEELLALRHTNGRAMVRIYGPANTQARGGTVTLNLYDPLGHLLDYRRVEELAGAENISLRTGCFCNPGAGEIAEGLTEEDMRAGFTLGAEINLHEFRPVDAGTRAQKRRRDSRFHRPRHEFCRRLALPPLHRRLPRPDPPDDRRRQLRHRVLPHHPRRQLSGACFSLWWFGSHHVAHSLNQPPQAEARAT